MTSTGDGGGTGMNIFNVALLTRAFLFFAYPSFMSGDKVWIGGMMKGEGVVDGFSGATPLAEAAAGNLENVPSAWDMFMGYIPGSISETSTLAILIGALILIYTGIGSWKMIRLKIIVVNKIIHTIPTEKKNQDNSKNPC